MPGEREAPPGEKERPGGYEAARPDQKSATTTDKPQTTAPPRQCSATPLRRRRRLWRPEHLSEVQVAAAAAAAHHLLARDLPPIFDLPTLQAMWRAGHHRLVDKVMAR